MRNRFVNRFNLPSRKIISEEEARRLLKPYLDLMLLSVKEAWESWTKLGEREPAFRKPLDTTARANIIWNHIKQNVKEKFKGITGVSICQKGRSFALRIENQAMTRFKKMDGKFRTSNVPTRRQMELQMQLQSANVALPGMADDATWLTCGYILDELQTKIEQIAVTCNIGSENKFIIPITADNVVTPIAKPAERTRRTAKVFPQRQPITKQAQAINE
jgi:hypothetical protein